MGTSSGSQHSREIASHWLTECVRTHNHDEKSLSFFPDRILEVVDGAGTMFRLLCKEKSSLPSVPQPYATLSYCWGIGNHLKLTASAMEQFISGVEVSELPKTFADAVSMAVTLNLRYLWIDSLCIIQDSREDWKEQSAMMGSIYQNSRITIAATSSSDSNDGLFYDRDPSSICSLQIHTNWLGVAQSLDWYEIVDQHPHVLDIQNAALNQRGWVFQERMLSKRLLHCTKGQLYWECEHLLANETYPQGLQTLPGNEPGQFSKLLKPSRDFTRSTSSEIKTNRDWLTLVHLYTRCDLTKDGDILVALSGLAKAWGAVFPDKYLAGIWYKSLPYGLLWWTTTSGTRQRTAQQSTDRIAPSWSWASCRMEVMWSYSLGFADPAEKVVSLAVYLNHSTTKLDSQDPTGAVTGGSLFVNGAVLKGAFVGMRELNIEYGIAHPGFRSLGLRAMKSDWSGSCSFDSQDVLRAADLDPHYPCFYIPLLAMKDGSSQTGPLELAIEGIMTEMVENNPIVHRRIGYFRVATVIADYDANSNLISQFQRAPKVEVLEFLGLISPIGQGYCSLTLE